MDDGFSGFAGVFGFGFEAGDGFVGDFVGDFFGRELVASWSGRPSSREAATIFSASSMSASYLASISPRVRFAAGAVSSATAGTAAAVGGIWSSESGIFGRFQVGFRGNLRRLKGIVEIFRLIGARHDVYDKKLTTIWIKQTSINEEQISINES
ncbi:MAG: hypothetical protein ACI8UO_003147 [Verrucomicrobiales bacterium]